MFTNNQSLPANETSFKIVVGLRQEPFVPLGFVSQCLGCNISLSRRPVIHTGLLDRAGGPKLSRPRRPRKVLRKLCELSETHIPASSRLRKHQRKLFMDIIGRGGRRSVYWGEAPQRLSWRSRMTHSGGSPVRRGNFGYACAAHDDCS